MTAHVPAPAASQWLWCPFCMAVLPDDTARSIQCPACAQPVDVASTRSASSWWVHAHATKIYAEDLHSQAQQVRLQVEMLKDQLAQIVALEVQAEQDERHAKETAFWDARTSPRSKENGHGHRG